ncbi:MAG: PH domain-containing protein [Gammaproteobacteria bacterium]
MSFTNVEVALETLPRLADVQFRELHASYARVVLGVALLFQIPAFVGLSVFLFAFLVPEAGLPWPIAGLLFVTALLVFVLAAWFAYTSSRVKRYALREHDVIMQSGVFWKKETIQPIRRIQHIEQHQGPIDKRFGLYELKLFSAGTARFTFRIPGLDADAASSIRRFILNVQEDGWGADKAPEAVAEETSPDPDA